MSTLADLIRAHQSNARALYAAPESDKTSAPGRYDATGSQRSPALDRRIEKLVARRRGTDVGMPDPMIPDVFDLEDLNDWLNGDWPPPPDTPDPPEPPEPPEPPDPPEPPEPPEPPLPVGYGTAYALHSGSISKTETGGATWANYAGSPSNPIGFSVNGDDAYVATSAGVFYGAGLRGWTELQFGSANIQIEGFRNGGFEGGMASWETVSGDSPRTGYVEHVIPSEGVSYLRRDWIIFTDGEFEVAQEVTLTPGEFSALAGSSLVFSGDIFGDGGTAELRIERDIEGQPYFRSGDKFDGDLVDSDPLEAIAITCSDIPDGATAARILWTHNITHGPNISNPYLISFSFRVDLNIGGAWIAWTHPTFTENAGTGPGNLSTGTLSNDRFRVAVSLQLTAVGSPGTINLRVPAGWRYPIDNNYAIWPDASSGGATEIIGIGAGWIPLASASGSEFTWNRVAATAASVPVAEIRCVIKATGTPADVYIDNCRLEIVSNDPGGVQPTAIGGDYVASSLQLYRMSPEGLTYFRTMEFAAEGIVDDGGLLVWGGSSIYIGDEGATYTLPAGILEAFNGPGGVILFMKTGEIWRRRNDPDYPGWDTLGNVGPAVDAAEGGGGYLAIGEGFLKTSGDLASWRVASPQSYGNRVISVGLKVLSWTEGAPALYWLDSTGWHLAGNLKAGIIDISTG